MSTTYHICQSISGALRNWRDKDWRGVCRTKEGKLLSPKAVKAEFERYIAEGKSVIPMGDCDNFDFETGCKGHKEP